MNDDCVSRQEAINAIKTWGLIDGLSEGQAIEILADEEKLPSAQPTLYGYNIKHLMIIAEVLKKENLPPERVTEALTGIERIVSIVRNEFEESLRKAVEQCMI